jgi:nucleoside phosphorylase
VTAEAPAPSPATTSPVGIVTGVRREAACLGEPPPASLDVGVSGADAARAYESARAMAGRGARALLSFGLAGGLDPTLGPGRIVVGAEVRCLTGPVDDPSLQRGLRDRLQSLFTLVGRRDAAGATLPPPEAEAVYRCDPALGERLLALAGSGARLGVIAGVDRAVARRDQKLALLFKTRAVVADMESAGVALAAAEFGLPFGVLRVVIDPSNRDLPHALLRSVRPNGSTSAAALLAGLARNPFELAGCLSLGVDALFAFRALRRVGRGLGPALAGGL